MRLIGEICIQWTQVEKLVLQAVCECNSVDYWAGNVLGPSVSFPNLLGLLEGLAGVLKSHHDKQKAKEVAKKINTSIQSLRAAYVLRCKCAHAEMTTTGPSTAPYLHIARLTQKVDISDRQIRLSEIMRDSDEIHSARDNFGDLMRSFGICTQPWF